MGERDGDEATPRPGGPMAAIARALIRPAWVVVGGLSALLAMWVLRIGESSTLGWMLSSAVHLALLGAWVPLLVALGARRRALGVAAGVLVAAQLLIVWPTLPWSGAASADEPALRLRSANAFVDNQDPDGFARAVLAGDLDVLSFTEFTPPVQAELERVGIDERFPHHVLAPDLGTVGTGIYSRYPMELVNDTGNGLTIVDVRPPDAAPIRVLVVHAFPPGGTDPGGWSRSLRQLDRTLAQTEGPWVAIGDYNATYDHRVYRDLIHGGRADAHLATGRGLARSWPAAGGLLPPLFLIDRAIVGPGVEALRTAEHTVPGSDHRALDVDVALAASPPE